MQTARTASQGHAPSAPPSIEEVRRRARHRLIGAAVLVLLGVIGFSLLFDTQPRSLPVDIPIVIPSKGPAPAPASPTATAPTASAPAAEKPVAEKPAAAPAAPVAASESLGPREEVVSAAPAPKPRPEPKPVAKPATPPEAKPVAKPSEADRARALLDGQTVGKTDAATQRIVVQVGAFADVARAREARLKLERAGLKTYTHVAETADGKRIRVRVGPFATKAEADKAAARVKTLGLPAAILTL
jgi:DedD protein